MTAARMLSEVESGLLTLRMIRWFGSVNLPEWRRQVRGPSCVALGL